VNESIEFHVFGGKKGESIIVRLPGDHWGVVDNYTPNLADPRSNPTLRFLESRHVKRLNFLCLTHPHEDHYRGMRHLLEAFHPDRIWIFGAMTPRDLFAQVADVLEVESDSSNLPAAQSEKVDELVAILDSMRDACKDRDRVPRLDVRRLLLGMPLLSLESDPPVKITSIGASGGRAMVYERALQSCFDASGNFDANGLAALNHNVISGGLLIEYGRARIVLGGDIDTDAWQETMGYFRPQGGLRSQLVKASHHGSATGYCDGLWDEMSPSRTATAVITPYPSQSLPSAEGLAHICDHAKLTLTTSVKAVAAAQDWSHSGFDTAFQGVSADALVTLRSIFYTASRPNDRLEGRCSFTVKPDGTFTPEFDGEAGRLAGG
jgi:hypothetical protein